MKTEGEVLPRLLFLFFPTFYGNLEPWSRVHRKLKLNTQFFNEMILINIQNTLEFS